MIQQRPILWNLILILLVLSWATSLDVPIKAQSASNYSGNTISLKGLPFCVLIVRDFLEENPLGHDIRILMESDKVSEDSLRQLFATISEKYPRPLLLRVHVYTDIEDLKDLASGVIIGGPDNPRLRSQENANGAASQREESIQEDGKVEHAWAFYSRFADREFFRYNPDYPKAGMKTVVLREAKEK